MRTKAAEEVVVEESNDGGRPATVAKESGQRGASKDRTPGSRQPFELCDEGVYRGADRICDWLKVVALTRDSESNDWGRLLEFRDPDGNLKRWAMPTRMLAGESAEVRGELLSMGLGIEPGRQAGQLLYEYLLSTNPGTRARCVSMTGWNGEQFVLPNEVIGATECADEIVFQSTVRIEDPFAPRGTLADWQESVGKYCVGNSRLLLAASIAFAAPLLPLVDAEGGGVHLQGQSSTGKSTATEVAASISGAGTLQSWRATDVGLELRGALSNHLLLCLDEIGQVDGRKLGEVAYMLANGHAKSRGTKTVNLRKHVRWLMLFLSNGELSLAQKIEEFGGRVYAGQEVRMVDVPADAGVGLGLFENLHGVVDARSFADQLKAATKLNTGTALRAFLDELSKVVADSAKIESLRSRYQASRSGFAADHCPAGADAQVHRVASRFALIAFAGQLATEFGIVPWPAGEATRGVAACFSAWLTQRGDTGPSEIFHGIAQVREFFERHAESRFVDLEEIYKETGRDQPPRRPISNRAGYRGDGYFLVFPQVMTSEILKGLNALAVKRALADRGMLDRDSQGRYLVTERLPDYGKPKRMYRISDRIFEEEEKSSHHGALDPRDDESRD